MRGKKLKNHTTTQRMKTNQIETRIKEIDKLLNAILLSGDHSPEKAAEWAKLSSERSRLRIRLTTKPI